MLLVTCTLPWHRKGYPGRRPGTRSLHLRRKIWEGLILVLKSEPERPDPTLERTLQRPAPCHILLLMNLSGRK